MKIYTDILKKITLLEKQYGVKNTMPELKKYLKKKQEKLDKILLFKYHTFVCTGEIEQVTLLAENEHQAEARFRELHNIPDEELVEILDLEIWEN